MSIDFNIKELDGASGGSWTPEVGSKITGKLLNIKKVQQTSFTSGEPLTWDDGTPRMQTVVELQTELHESDDDDGIRAVWLKGGNYDVAKGTGMSGEKALYAAIQEAGVEQLDEGDIVTVECSGLAKPTQKGFQQAKLYVVNYEKAKMSMAASDLFDEG